MSKIVKPTDAELEILNILWDKGAATVRDIHDEIIKTKAAAGYTTSLKLMQIMFEKGLLSRDASSRTHIYKAAVSRAQTQGQIMQRVIDTVFNGSAMQMVMQALGNHQASSDELLQIKEYLEELEAQEKGKKK